MGDINKAAELYGLMAERCEKSRHAQRQAKVYREMLALIKDCPTLTEATAKIRSSKYYLAPSAALLQDKLAALAKASQENDMPDVAEVYEKKIAEIDDDIEAMYETGYERTALNLKVPYIQTCEAFCDIYDSYLLLSCCNSDDQSAINGALRNLSDALAKLAKPAADFAQLAGLERFRQLIPANDRGYTRFVQTVNQISASGVDYGQEKRKIDEELKEVQQLVAADASVIKKRGQENLKIARRSQVVVVPPDSASGSYSYRDEEVMPFA